MRLSWLSAITAFGLASPWLPVEAQDDAAASSPYGVDCSFPIHSKEFRCGDLLGDRKKFYEDFMQGCRDYYGRYGPRCDATEDERIVMSVRQPQSMVVRILSLSAKYVPAYISAISRILLFLVHRTTHRQAL